jgi:hypothetical protein
VRGIEALPAIERIQRRRENLIHVELHVEVPLIIFRHHRKGVTMTMATYLTYHTKKAAQLVVLHRSEQINSSAPFTKSVSNYKSLLSRAAPAPVTSTAISNSNLALVSTSPARGHHNMMTSTLLRLHLPRRTSGWINQTTMRFLSSEDSSASAASASASPESSSRLHSTE